MKPDYKSNLTAKEVVISSCVSKQNCYWELAISSDFPSTREASAQECVYRCMPEFWLRKVFPKTLFVNTDFQ